MICKEPGCLKKHFGKGYCRTHYERMKRNGTTEPKYDLSKYSSLGGIKDTRPGARGYLAVNIINDIKYKALKRGKEWCLSHREAFDLICADCNYCGVPAKWPKGRNGIDRVDNSVGYACDNCVSSCFTCNSAKGEMTVEEFAVWVALVYNKLNV